MSVENYKQLNAAVENLEAGLLMVSARPTKTESKYNVEFAQKIVTNVNPLQVLNASDDRFSTPKSTRCWQTVEVEDFKKQFGIDLTALETIKDGMDRDVIPLLVHNPKLKFQGQEFPLNIEILETTEAPNEWAEANPDKAIKQDGQGNFLFVADEDGVEHPIYRTTRLVTNKPNHKFVRHTHTNPATAPSIDLTENTEVYADV